MLPILGKSIYDQAQLSGAEAAEAAEGGGSAPLAGTIYLEPLRWQTICVPTVFGHWGSLGSEGWAVWTGSTATAYDGDGNVGPGQSATVLLDRDIGGDAADAWASTNSVGALASVVLDKTSTTGLRVDLRRDTNAVRFRMWSSGGLPTELAASSTLSFPEELCELRLEYSDGSYRGFFNGVEVVSYAVARLPGRRCGFVLNGTEVTCSDFACALGTTTFDEYPAGTLLVGTSPGYSAATGVILDGTTVAKAKNYIIDQLEDKYGAGVVEIARTLPGDENRWLSYVPGSTPEGNEHNFALGYEDEVGSGNYEFAAIEIKSLHADVMELTWGSAVPGPDGTVTLGGAYVLLGGESVTIGGA